MLEDKFKDIQCVVCDIDGTLVVKNDELPKQTIMLIKKLEQFDIKFLFASGRVPERIYPLMKQLGLEEEFLVACNGALLVHRNNIVFNETFPVELITDIVNVADAYDMTVLYTEGAREYCHKETSDSYKKRKSRGTYYPIKALKLLNHEITKLNILSKGRIGNLDKQISKLRETLNVTTYGLDGVEIVHASVNKKTGVEHYCSLMGFDLKNIMAIGDNENDLELFEAVRIPVAVNNATMEAKKSASIVTQGVSAEGVAEILQKLIESKK